MPGYNDVQKAFQDAFTNQIQKKTFDAGPVDRRDQGGHRQGTRPVAPSRIDRGHHDVQRAPADRIGRGRSRAANAGDPGPHAKGASLGGSRRLPVRRRADGPVPGPEHRGARCTPSTSASGGGTCAPARSRSWGSRTTRMCWAIPRSSVPSRTPSTTRSCGSP